METAERRSLLLKMLCRRRHDTIRNLASEFGVSTRTVQRDVESLSRTEPIYTQCGRYGGGVYIVDGYVPDRMYMTEMEIAVLQKLFVAAERCTTLLTKDEKEVLKAVITHYTKPQSASE